MSDKYEEVAIRATVECLPNEESPLLMEILPRAFRWYEETYLAEALTAAAMMREKETCEWAYDDIDDYYDTACGRAFVTTTGDPLTEHGIRYCHYCGRRIVEKVQPPEGGGDE